jgi:peptidoglycan/xylan/chitin deacetylase (PgdA/CDA1 family)
MYLTRQYLHVFLLLLSCISVSSCSPDTAEPQGGISISFDDRSIEEWYSLKELFARYDAKVTFFISGAEALTDQEVQMLKELVQQGHEVGSHGALHVRARDYIREYSYQKYLQDEVFSNTRALQDKGFTPTAFAYPFGRGYWFTDLILKNSFKVIRRAVSVDSIRGLSATDDIFFSLGKSRELVAASIDASAQINKKAIDSAIQKAATEKKVLLVFGHKPAHNAKPNSYTFDVALLEYILQQAKEKDLKFYRISDLVQD